MCAFIYGFYIESLIFGIFLVAKFVFMCAFDCFENNFLGKNRILSGSVLYMWTALCRKLLDVLAESDLYWMDGFRTWRLISDLVILWYNNCESAGGCDSYEILWISLTDSCIIIWWELNQFNLFNMMIVLSL